MTENRLLGVSTFYWGDNFKEKKHGLGWLIEYRGITTPVTFKHEGASLMAMYADPLEEFIAVFFINAPLYAQHHVGWTGILDYC